MVNINFPNMQPNPKWVEEDKKKYLENIAKAEELDTEVLEAYVEGAQENMGVSAKIYRCLEANYRDRLGVYEKVLRERKYLS
jgi:hypothetical protein